MKRISTRQVVITLVPAGCVLAVIVAMRVFFSVPSWKMTGDIAAIAEINPLYGILSNLGVLLWCVTATVCGFAAAMLPRRARGTAEFRFLVASALLSGYLLLDDLFQFHEDLAERYFSVPEPVVLAVLGIAAVAYLVAYRRVIARTRYGMLILAFVLFGLSMTLDEFFGATKVFGYAVDLLEDGTKWLGIACWCSYYLQTSYVLASQALKAKEASMAVSVPAVGYPAGLQPAPSPTTAVATESVEAGGSDEDKPLSSEEPEQSASPR